MKRVTWISFTANDGHSIGLDSNGVGWELHNGELHRLPDPPQNVTNVKAALGATRRRRSGGETATRRRRARQKQG